MRREGIIRVTMEAAESERNILVEICRIVCQINAHSCVPTVNRPLRAIDFYAKSEELEEVFEGGRTPVIALITSDPKTDHFQIEFTKEPIEEKEEK